MGKVLLSTVVAEVGLGLEFLAGMYRFELQGELATPVSLNAAADDTEITHIRRLCDGVRTEAPSFAGFGVLTLGDIGSTFRILDNMSMDDAKLVKVGSGHAVSLKHHFLEAPGGTCIRAAVGGQ